MHSATLTIVDGGRLRGAWTNLKGGITTWVAVAELTRRR
jgi:hypothetical protein